MSVSDWQSPSWTCCYFHCMGFLFCFVYYYSFVISVCCLFRTEKKIICPERNNLGNAYLPFALSFQTVLTLGGILGDCPHQIVISDCISFFIKVTYDRNLTEAVGKKQTKWCKHLGSVEEREIIGLSVMKNV